MRLSQFALVCAAALFLISPPALSAQATYEGPESVPVFHPLCLLQLKAHQSDGGAFDMVDCAAAMQGQGPDVKRTPNGGYFAKEGGDNAGRYVLYQPIGTLDDSLELLLVHQGQGGNMDSAVYVIGRLPGAGSLRDYITSIEEKGRKCRGGIQSAQLISEAILEISLNVNPHTLLQMFGYTTDGQKASGQGLDNREAHCVATVTKRYDLLNNREFLHGVTFLPTLLKPLDTNPVQACFNRLVQDSTQPEQLITLEEFNFFVNIFDAECM